jgi:hypothetical protein
MGYKSQEEKKRKQIVQIPPGANPTIFEFTATTPAL